MINDLSSKRVALVLGAGGPVGHAFHAGVLEGIYRSGAWDAREAHLVVGTSAGAQVAALLRGGAPPRDLLARITGDPLTPTGASVVRHFTRPGRDDPADPRNFLPADVRQVGRMMLRPWRYGVGQFMSALLPEGRVVLDPMAEGLRNVFGHAWPDRHLWIPAVHLGSGRRVVFGHPDAPSIDVGTAVASSGAVPGVCAPVKIHRERYVDGGMFSPTNLDLAVDGDVDCVVVSSPLSRFAPVRHRLRRQAARLARPGVPIYVVEPTGSVIQAMGWNPMDLARAPAVAKAALDATLEGRGIHIPLEVPIVRGTLPPQRSPSA